MALDPSSISFMLSISSVGRPKIPPGNGLGHFFGLMFDRLVIVPFHRQFLHFPNVCTFLIPIDHSTHDDNDGIFSHFKSPTPSTVSLA